jgi:hypothetical protein
MRFPVGTSGKLPRHSLAGSLETVLKKNREVTNAVDHLRAEDECKTTLVVNRRGALEKVRRYGRAGVPKINPITQASPIDDGKSQKKDFHISQVAILTNTHQQHGEYEPKEKAEAAYFDLVSHLRIPMKADTIPILSDSCRSEATLFVTYKVVSDRSQGFATVFTLLRSPFQGRRLDPPPEDLVAPSIRAGGELRQRTPELQFALPPVATRKGLTRPSE